MTNDLKLYVIHVRHFELLETGGASESTSQFYLAAADSVAATKKAYQMRAVQESGLEIVAVQELATVEGYRIELSPIAST